jgi:excisionase family DNA binding protein
MASMTAPSPLLESLRPFVREVVREAVAEVMSKQNQPRYMSTSKASGYTGMSPTTLHNLVAKGELKRCGVGRNFRFDVRDLDALMEGK